MIKNIIFDLGGVIIDLDPGATISAFENLGFTEFPQLYSQAKQSGLFDVYDKGRISDSEFRDSLRRFATRPVTDVEIDNAWNAMLLHVPGHRLELLAQLKKKYRIFLLSNTNQIHVREFSKQLYHDHELHDFTAFFEKCYYSCDMGMRKPDAEIFEFVLSENKLLKEETIFIDDSPQHVYGANSVGIKGFLLPKNMEIKELLSKIV